MSASDKKQQRRAETAEGLTQRQQKERAEALAAKRKKTTYTVVGVVCAAAAAALLVWNGLNSRGHGGDIAATVGGVDYTVADLQYYYVMARNSAYTQYQQFAQMGFSLGYDPSVSEGEQWYNEAEGKTYADSFRDNALSLLQQTAALCAEADAQGYTLSEAGKKTVEEQLASLDLICAQNGMTRNAYFAQVYGNGVTEKVFVRNLTNDILAAEFSDQHKEGISYDDAALDAYYKEHSDTLDSYDYRVFVVDGSVPPTTDAEGNTTQATDEEKAAAMAAAKDLADEALEKLEAVSISEREKTFIEIAPDYVAEEQKDDYAAESYSLQQKVLGSALSSGGESSSWLMAPEREVGDVTVIETSTGYQVLLFLNRYLVKDPTVNVRHILVMADRPADDPQGAPTQEAMDAAKAEAEALLEEWKAGDATAESFGALADEHSDDGGSKGNGGRYTYISEGDMVGVFNDWIFDPARQPGDTGLVCHNGEDADYYGWHVIYFEKAEEPSWKGTAIQAKQSADQTEWLNGLTDAVEAAAVDGMQYVGVASSAVPTPSATPAESVEPEESPAA